MSTKNYNAPARCPVCGGSMQVTGLKCAGCGTELKGRFCALDEKNLRFVEVFLRCRGSIKEVERSLGVSYPTVKNMLEAALSALRLDEDPNLREAREEEDRQEILSRLAQGELNVDAAVEALKQLKGGKKS